MTEAALPEQHREAIGELQGSADLPADQTWTQYVTFAVDGRSYGVDITKVREIKGWSEPTALPNAPHAMRGVLNLRGIVVPIFDLRAQFGLGRTEPCQEHVVIIFAFGDRLIGVLVDAVSDILTLEPGDVLPVPAIDSGDSHRFMSGLVSRDDRLVALLKLEELFNIGDLPSELF
ncbi:MAG: chemotaxis protein CheW [Pseudomonadota bacterium]